MGGIGSGNWYRWDKKTILNEVKRIDIRYMRKHGLLKPGYMGSLRWARGGEPNGDIRYAYYKIIYSLITVTGKVEMTGSQ